MKIRAKFVSAVLIVTAVTTLGITALVTTTPAAHGFICECADLDNPVICQGGRIYPNPCVASCFKAKNCRPYR